MRMKKNGPSSTFSNQRNVSNVSNASNASNASNVSNADLLEKTDYIHIRTFKRGKQGIAGLVEHRESGVRYVYKVSQHIDFLMDHEFGNSIEA